MCYTNCPYENREGECILRGRIYPQDAFCSYPEESTPEPDETISVQKLNEETLCFSGCRFLDYYGECLLPRERRSQVKSAKCYNGG